MPFAIVIGKPRSGKTELIKYITNEQPNVHFICETQKLTNDNPDIVFVTYSNPSLLSSIHERFCRSISKQKFDELSKLIAINKALIIDTKSQSCTLLPFSLLN